MNEMRMFKYIFVILSAIIFSVQATEELSWLDDVSRQSKNISSHLEEELNSNSGDYFKEKFNSFTGAYHIEVFSIESKGNFPLFSKISLTETPKYWKYVSIGDLAFIKELSIPRVHGRVTFFGQDWDSRSKNICSNEVPTDELYHRQRYGPYAILENGQENILLKRESTNSTFGNAVYYTKDNSVVECKVNNSGQEYFFITDKSGNKYTFDRITYAKGDSGGLNVLNYNFLATKIEDKFGNTVNFDYDVEEVASPYSLTKGSIKKITWSDGRQMTFDKVNNQFFNINYAGNTWKVDIWKGNETRNIILPNNDTLSIIYEDSFNNVVWDYEYKYVYPDGSFKKYESTYMVGCGPYISSEGSEDVLSYDGSSGTHYCKVPYPESSPFYRPDNTHTWMEKRYFPTLKRKTVSISNGLDSVYTYDFVDGLLDLRQSNTIVPRAHTRRTIEVSGPINITGYVHDPSFNYKEGELVERYVLDNSTRAQLSKTTFTYDYKELDGYACWRDNCENSDRLDNKKNWEKYHYKRLLKKRALYINGDEHVTEVMSRDEFDRTSKKRLSSNDERRYVKYNYVDFKNIWALSNLDNISYSDDGLVWKSSISFDYYSESSSYKGAVKAIYRHGVLLKQMDSYHSDGNVLLVTYNDTDYYEKFEDYFRGTPRKTTLPCSLPFSCDLKNSSTNNTLVSTSEVYDDGTIESITDYLGNKIKFTYSPLGWLESTDYLDSKWLDRDISYSRVSIEDDGITASQVRVGQLKQTITQGKYKKVIYYDGLQRPFLTLIQDTTDSSTIQFFKTDYDHDGRVKWHSYPSRSADNRIGVQIEYDSLGRIITHTRTSDNAITRYEYLAGNKIRVKDPKNNELTKTFLSYGSPTYDNPILIQAPDTDDIRISYNLFDQVTSLTQGIITENRFYDSHQQLCKIVRPETGITAYAYNAQRQPVWHALGTVGNITSCDTSAVPESDKTYFGYDNLRQLYTENFPDDTPDRIYNYDGNGNLIRLQSGSVVWDYDYNSLGAIEKETLAVDGKEFVLDWGYNSLGALSSLKYPSGHTVDFAPNALGQPTRVGNYASSVSYHPNGQLSGFIYGNGVTRSIALDTTGRIDAITDIKGTTLVSLDPSYDDNDNLEGLIDWVDRRNDVDNLSYDGMNRLKTANGRWGTGSYSYDGLGNIESRILNGSVITYHYNDVLNRLERLSGAYAYGYQYDSRGNVTHNGRYSLDYNQGQQMTAAKGIGYLYDGHNRRVRKTVNGKHSYSVYSQEGQLLYRQQDDGDHVNSIYLGKSLIATAEYRGDFIPLPEITMHFVGGANPCPPREVCPHRGDTALTLSWITSHATSCSGEVTKNSFPIQSLSGISNTGIDISGDTTATFKATLDCSGPGGRKQVVAFPSDNGGI